MKKIDHIRENVRLWDGIVAPPDSVGTVWLILRSLRG